MIYDTLAHIQAYQGIHPGVYRGLELLRDTDFSRLEDRRYEVDGEDLYFFLQSYDSKPVNDTPEAHRKYIDIQFLIQGEEKIGVAPLEDMTEEVEARPDGDIWFYHGPTDEITLKAGGAFRCSLARRRPCPMHRCGSAGPLPQVCGQGQAGYMTVYTRPPASACGPSQPFSGFVSPSFPPQDRPAGKSQ